MATRAALAELRGGERSLESVLVSPDLGHIRVGALLRALYHVGPVRSERFLTRHLIHPHRRLRELTVRQRAIIQQTFGRRGFVSE